MQIRSEILVKSCLTDNDDYISSLAEVIKKLWLDLHVIWTIGTLWTQEQRLNFGSCLKLVLDIVSLQVGH